MALAAAQRGNWVRTSRMESFANASDGDLVARTRAGQRDAYGELVRRHQATVYNIAYRLVGERETALDLAQETFVRAFSALASFDATRAFAPWLHRIATNAALNWLERQRVPTVPLEYDDAEPAREIPGESNDPAAPGRLRWHAEPELSGTGRPMCMAEADGVLYAACGIKDDSPQSGGLFRRVDGPQPKWELVYRWQYKLVAGKDESEIMRGLTAIPDPQGGAHEVLLGTRSYSSTIERIDPAKNFAVTVELNISRNSHNTAWIYRGTLPR